MCLCSSSTLNLDVPKHILVGAEQRVVAQTGITQVVAGNNHIMLILCVLVREDTW